MGKVQSVRFKKDPESQAAAGRLMDLLRGTPIYAGPVPPVEVPEPDSVADRAERRSDRALRPDGSER